MLKERKMDWPLKRTARFHVSDQLFAEAADV
jgi:hypothetical protein